MGAVSCAAGHGLSRLEVLALSSFPFFTLLFLVVTGWLGWSLVAGARLQRARSEALTEHVRGLAPALIPAVHDRVVEQALAHYSERELRAGRTRIEYAVALRDRLDELGQRDHGPLNRARIRSQLLPAAHRLRGYPNPFRVREFRETFLLAPQDAHPAAISDGAPIDIEAIIRAMDTAWQARG